MVGIQVAAVEGLISMASTSTTITSHDPQTSSLPKERPVPTTTAHQQAVVGLVRLPEAAGRRTPPKEATAATGRPTDFSFLSPGVSRASLSGLRDIGLSNDANFADVFHKVSWES